MAIYLDEETRLVVQGASGNVGRELVSQMAKFENDVVAGVAPGRSGTNIGEIPVFESVQQAVDDGANTSLIAVPAPYVKDACFEAIEAGIETIVAVTENVPVKDVLHIREYGARWETDIIGPNTLGVMSPGRAAAMLIYKRNDDWFEEGSVGLFARSGSFSVELANRFTKAGLGQTTVLSVGGDPYVGTPPADVFRKFDADPETEVIVYVGEIGSNYEEEAAEILPEIETPVCASIIGQHAPPGKRMGHAGAIAQGDADKLSLLEEAGATIRSRPDDLIDAVRDRR